MTGTVNQSIMPITARVNEENHLEIGGCDTVKLAEQYGTPLYVYDEATIRKVCNEYKDAFSAYDNIEMLFASKAFLTKAMCCILKQENFGIDVVSGGEVYTAWKSNFPMEKALFNGNNKTVEELELAIDAGVGRISVDNFLELALLDEIARSKNTTVKIILRIAPGIECHTHEYIQTGHIDSKFGFDLSQIEEAVELICDEYKNLELKGLHAHIGSQIFETQVYYDIVGILTDLFVKIKEKFGLTLDEMNLGGGLGIKYTENDNPPSICEIAEIIIRSVNENVAKYGISRPKLYIEPGRSIVATAGITLYTAGSYKNIPNIRKYVLVDGGMSDNPRPALYQAVYKAMVANKANDKASEKVTLAGKHCESSDIVIKDIELPEIDPGDIICVFDTGAYNYSMSSNYNRSPRAAAILVQNGQTDVIIKRETYEDLTAKDVIPERLSC